MSTSASGQKFVTLGIDASSTVGERTGIGVATSNLLSALASEAPEGWKIKAFVNSARLPLPNDPWTRAPNVQIRHTKLPGRLLLRSWQHFKIPSIETLIGPIDLYHSPASYLTPVRRAPLILSVHDLYFLEPGEHPDPYGGDYFSKTFPSGLASCDQIIAVSAHTKTELLRRYQLKPERIAVIPHGLDTSFFHPGESPGEDEAAIRRLTSGESFLLCVTTFGPTRKNVTGLIEAYARARDLHPALPRLLIVGKAERPEGISEYEAAVDRMKLGAFVSRTGYVTGYELRALYRRAVCLVVPSISEGFGLPLLEAMGCGCPVVTSSGGALPEVAGDAAFLVKGSSCEELGGALALVEKDHKLRQHLRAAGLERVKQFSWTSTARATLDLYREVLES